MFVFQEDHSGCEEWIRAVPMAGRLARKLSQCERDQWASAQHPSCVRGSGIKAHEVEKYCVAEKARQGDRRGGAVGRGRGGGRRLQSAWHEQLPRERCRSLSWRPDPSSRRTFVVGAGRVSSGVARARAWEGARSEASWRDSQESELTGPCGPFREPDAGRVTSGSRQQVLMCCSKMGCTKRARGGPEAAGKGLGLV